MKKRKLKKSVEIIIAVIAILLIGFLVITILNNIPEKEPVEITYGDIGKVEIEEDPVFAPELNFYVLDVGQAESIFIDCENFEALIDAGSYDDGSTKVSDFIRPYIQGDLDLVISTHSHEDHMGGMSQIYDEFKVAHTIYGDLRADGAWCDIFKEKASKSGVFEEDYDTTIEIAPKTTLTIYDVADDEENLNSNSVVCVLRHGDVSFYFAGDIEEEQETLLRKKLNPVDVYVLSHHGSDTSNSIIDVLKPRLILSSTGKNNDYGHITENVLEKSLKATREVYATYKSGTMKVTSDGKHFTYDMDKEDRLTIEDVGAIVKKKK